MYQPWYSLSKTTTETLATVQELGGPAAQLARVRDDGPCPVVDVVVGLVFVGLLGALVAGGAGGEGDPEEQREALHRRWSLPF